MSAGLRAGRARQKGEHRDEGGARLAGQVEVRVQVTPASPFRLPLRSGFDGLTRVHGGVLHRLVHAGDEPVLVRATQLCGGDVLIGAQAAHRAAADEGIARMRRALGVDLDLLPFVRRFRDDPLIGASVRASPGLRPGGRPAPFEALAWAICEQLIEFERATAIERRLIARLGRRCPVTGLRDAPPAARIAAQAPALLESCDLAPKRALTLWRAAREVALGRVDLEDPEHERGWRRLRAIPGVGPWTVQMLALTGQGRLDQLPAGDLGYLKALGRIASGGDPRARATVEEVERLFEPYAPWRGLAGMHFLRSAGTVKIPAAAA